MAEDDLDFDAIEQMLEEAPKQEAKRDRSRSRGRDRDRRRGGSRDRGRRDRSRGRYRSRDRSRRRRTTTPEREMRRKEREEREKRKNEEERQNEQAKLAEQAQRDDCTVLVMCLHHKAVERDVYEHFTKNCGKVRDIQLIRDARTGKSKGIAYIEFYLQEGVQKALQCTGHTIMGVPIRVQASQAEKNRMVQSNKNATAAVPVVEMPIKRYVDGLTGPLENIQEGELRKLFEPFGDIDFIDLHSDPYTGKSKGFAYVQYKMASDAKEAMAQMNGLVVAGQTIRVGMPQNKGRALAGPAAPLAIGNGAASFATAAVPPPPPAEPVDPLANPVSELPTSNLILSNMYNAKDPKADEDFFLDVEDDVREECEKHGEVKKVFLNKEESQVWVAFGNAAGAITARQALVGRWFDGKQIKVDFTSDQCYQLKLQYI
eukprot:gene35-167_t